jgi:hypothetical protein
MFKWITIQEGDRILLRKFDGTVRSVDGPRRIWLWRETAERMQRYAAEPHQFLRIRYQNGSTEHLAGPTSVWFDPIVHVTIEIDEATKLDANEALIVYAKENEHVTRRVLRGPSLFVPSPEEWIHEFRWHGSDPRQTGKKVPRALIFQKLRVIPDQMYLDIENVRTADDALLVVKVMVFFELIDIERMLDQTHDPIADFINALGADVVCFVGSRTFDAFKAQTEALNVLETYPQLTQRAEKIGYHISKVVYRGYYASEKLQAMHDGAIECRTKLHLEKETERQAQDLADMKLACEFERTSKRQQMEEAATRHANHLRQLENEAQLLLVAARQSQALEARRHEENLALEVKREQGELALRQQIANQHEQAKFFAAMREMQVDLTKYLVAQYQHPDKLIRIDHGQPPQLHLHEY